MDELTITSKSVFGKKLRGFRTLVWESSTNTNQKPAKAFWITRTNFKRHTFIRYLKLKVLFGRETKEDLRCLLDLNEVVNDELYMAALRVTRTTSIEFNIIIERLNTLCRFLDQKEYELNDLWTLEGTLSFEREEKLVSIRKALKYSGYVRNISSLGTKKSSGSRPEPEMSRWNNKLSIDFLTFLSVGEFSTGQPGGSFFTLKSSKRAKRP